MAEWSKAPDSSSGPLTRAWVQIPLLTFFLFFIYSSKLTKTQRFARFPRIIQNPTSPQNPSPTSPTSISLLSLFTSSTESTRSAIADSATESNVLISASDTPNETPPENSSQSAMAESATEANVLNSATETPNEPPPADSTQSAMDESATESSALNSVFTLTTEELVAKSIAPVKKEFLRPPPSSRLSAAEVDKENVNGDNRCEKKSIVKDKKSKRQLKRERQNERKSTLHLCAEVAKTEDVSACRYGDKCRFSHDVEAYKSQRPADLEGECPFVTAKKRCPYGMTCRYTGTHVAVSDEILDDLRKGSEVNLLKKDVQKLLWKNKMKFPKSNTALKQLGLAGMGFTKVTDTEDKEEVDPAVSNGSHISDKNGCEKGDTVGNPVESSVLPEEGSLDGVSGTDDIRPLKKAKPEDEGKPCSDDTNNGDAVMKDPIDGEPCSASENTSMETEASLKLHPRERKLIDFRGKMYLAPLTTVGNLPFRRVCKVLGADVTCGEMAMCTNLLQGQASEWALLRRHESEDLFGVQICGAYPDTVARAVELIDQECSVDFIDINMGCPIDLVVNKGAGSALLTKPMRMKNVIQAACASAEKPITVKVRTGYIEGRNRVDSLISDIYDWGASAITIHGRSRQQRYSKLADWEYVYKCVQTAPCSLPVLGNGDVFSYLDWNKHLSDCPELSSCMIARGALIKPWLFTEIKEQRHWDISSGERLEILKNYVRFGLEHWGSDSKGVETTRHFLLEWLSYMFRYVPVGLMEVVPQRLNWRPPSYFGRDDLETMMASESAADWIRISEMLLGKVPEGFNFTPKHKSNAYDSAENG